MEYSEQEIIEEIKRVAKLLNITPLTGKAFEKTARVSRGVVNRRLGSWKAALEAAELGHLYAGQVVTAQMKAQPNRGTSDEDLLEYLRNLSVRLGRNDISVGDIKSDQRIDRNVFPRRFGSWQRAVELAGLSQRQLGAARRVHSDEQLFSNLRETWEHLGRQPHYSEMNRLPSKLKSKNYVNRFGTWRKALLAFIEFVETESISDKNSSSTGGRAKPQVIAASGFPVSGVTASSKDRREISLGLRFRVLYRDNFKCVLCGNNPPASPGLVLHVDHVVPWSKGGKTELENLRTLCIACNLGRGNAYSD